MSEILYNILLPVHIICGAMGLVLGTANLIRRKGDPPHRRIGRLFVAAMITAGCSAIVLSVIHPNFFLTVVGIFTVYMVGTGHRYILLRLREVDNDARNLDWALTIGMAIAVGLFVILGIRALLQQNMMGLVYFVFGLIGFLFVRTDFDNYRSRSKHRNYWLLAHLQRMTGGYIAALTAFLVVNADRFPEFIPGVVYWLLPTVILTPMIIKWSRDYSIGHRA